MGYFTASKQLHHLQTWEENNGRECEASLWHAVQRKTGNVSRIPQGSGLQFKRERFNRYHFLLQAIK